MYQESVSPIRQRQLLAGLSLFAGVLFTGLLLAIADHGVFFPFEWTADYSKLSYGITIDAGSHGTRGHLYSWSGRVEDPLNPQARPVTVPREIFTFEPGLKGISEFVGNTSRVGPEVLAPITQAMRAELARIGVSQREFADIPVYVKATAGMRNMDVDAADSVFSAIRLWLSQEARAEYPNIGFKFENDWARVISGEEEGVFGWLAVNSDHGTLLSDSGDTIGAMDLGGASAQITFMPTTASVLEDFYAVSLGEKVVRLYSHSFLGYGWDDSRMRVTTRLALASFFESLITDLNGRNITTASEIIHEFLNGSLPSFTRGDQDQGIAGLTKKQVKNAIYVDPTTDDLPLFLIKAHHPCFPAGFSTFFDVPSLVYPDGRFFLDIDDSAILAYMASVGYDLDNKVITENFSRKAVSVAKKDPLRHFTMRPVMDTVLENFRVNTSAKDLAISANEAEPFHPFKQYMTKPQIKFRVLFEGQGNMQKCQALANQLFYREPCFLSSCSYNGVYQPRIKDSHFLALGQFAKVRAALNIPLTATPNTMEKRAAAVCGSDWHTLARDAQNGVYLPFKKSSIANLCWKAVWAHATLTTGYGFDGDSHAVTFFDINGTDGAAKSPGWALGAMLNEVSGMPWESSRGRFKIPFWWASATVLALGSLACLQAAKIKQLRRRLPQTRSDVYIQYTPEINP